MRREYKGFFIEPAGGGSGRSANGYSIYHVVTGNCGGTLPTIRDAKDEIDSIHTDAEVYARFAGCKAFELVPKRGRWIYGGKR
jgi:hypothetical protein